MMQTTESKARSARIGVAVEVAFKEENELAMCSSVIMNVERAASENANIESFFLHSRPVQRERHADVKVWSIASAVCVGFLHHSVVTHKRRCLATVWIMSFTELISPMPIHERVCAANIIYI